MNRTTIAQLYADQAAFGGQTVTGWARTIRAMKNLGFLTLNDGSCFKNLQVVLEKTLANYDEVSSQNVGAAFIVTGKLVLTPDAKQPFELQAETVNQPVLRHLSGAQRSRPRHPLLLPRSRLRLRPHSHHHRQRLRGCW